MPDNQPPILEHLALNPVNTVVYNANRPPRDLPYEEPQRDRRGMTAVTLEYRRTFEDGEAQ